MDNLLDQLKLIIKENPNDSTLGAEVRKLIIELNTKTK